MLNKTYCVDLFFKDGGDQTVHDFDMIKTVDELIKDGFKGCQAFCREDHWQVVNWDTVKWIESFSEYPCEMCKEIDERKKQMRKAK